MPTIAVFGATGTLGRRVVARLEPGVELVLVGRDTASLAEVGHAAPGAATTRIVDLDRDPDAALAEALLGVDLAVSALPVAGGIARRVVDAAVAGAVHLIDTADAQPHLQRAYEELDARARESGTVVVPGVGWRTAFGDLLASVAAGRTDQPRQVHVAAVVPDRGGVLGAASPGVLRGIAASLGVPTTVIEHGDRAEELAGEVRRLAWFPRPFGPHHAAGVPGLEALSVPRHIPGVRTVRSYVALSSARAELLQAVANLSRRRVVRDRVAANLERRAGRAPAAGARWAVVAEVAGDGDGYARGWANGGDHLDASARLVAAIVDAVLAGLATPGVVAPAEVGAAADLLDAVAATSEVRWSVADPRPR